MTTRGSMGWLVLALSLSVPLFMFYKKWTEIDKARRSETAANIRKRVPDSMLFDQQNGASAKLTNPIAADAKSAAPASGLVAASTAPAAPAPQVPPAAAAAQEPEAPKKSGPAPEPAAAKAPAPAPAPAAAPAPEAVQASTQAAAAPPAAEVAASSETFADMRDPTLSPYDVYRIEQRKLEEMLKRQEVERAVQKLKPARVKEPPIESTINLQGIISNAESGNKAIVNDEVVAVGDMVGQAQVLAISAQYVTFKYKARKFKKYVRD